MNNERKELKAQRSIHLSYARQARRAGNLRDFYDSVGFATDCDIQIKQITDREKADKLT